MPQINKILVAYKFIRDAMPHLEIDRIPVNDIESMVGLIKTGILLEEVEYVVGELL